MTQNSQNSQNSHKRFKVLGLTGGIASGKSVASGFLRKRGGCILDADKISHNVIMKGEKAHGKVLSAIPGDYVKENGQIDRKKLGAIVFNDNKALKALEKIVHKHTIDEIIARINELCESPGEYSFIVIDAPLLIESGLHKSCDAVWVVRACYDMRIERLMVRNGLTKPEADNRIKLQTDWDNLQNGGYVFIDNNGSIQDFFTEIDKNLKVFLD